MTPARFPHSDTPGSTLGCQLPRAYRRLLRPSSALDAKASTTCPSQLVTHTTNPTPNQEPDRRCTQHTTKKHNTHQPINQCMPTNKHNKRPSPTNKKSRQMLASTIQISNNNPTPPPHPHTGDTGMTGTEAPAPTLPRPPQETQEAKKAARPDSSEPQQHVCRPAPTRPQEPDDPDSKNPGDAHGLLPHLPNSTRRHHTTPPTECQGPVMDRSVCSLERR